MLVSELERFRMDPQQTYVTGKVTRQTPAILSNIPRWPHLAVYQLRTGSTMLFGVTETSGSRRKLVATISLNAYQLPKFFQPVEGFDVNFTKVMPSHQGQGLGLAVYREFILQLQWNLYATGSHSLGGEKLWRRLSQTPGITVYLLRKPHTVVVPVLTSQGLKLPGGEDFYDTDPDQAPWSLIAVNDSSPANNILKSMVKNA
jgi:hypothetical protein